MTKHWLSGVALAAALAFSGAANAQIKMGVAGPITGPNAAFGAQLVNGTQQAVDDINKAGGILGQQITLEQGDDVSDPKQGVSVANKFVGDGVKFVVGHFNSGVTIPASDVYAENGILFITPVGDQSEGHRPQAVGRVPHLRPRRPAGHAVGRTRARQAQGQEDRRSSTTRRPTARASPTPRSTTCTSSASRKCCTKASTPARRTIRRSSPRSRNPDADYLMWGGLQTEGGLILRQMRDQGMKTVMISGDGITNNEFSQIGGPGVEGTLMSFGPDPRKNPAAKDVVAEFKAKNFDPEAYTLYSYAAVQIMKQAAEKAKSLDPKKVAEAMHSGMTFNTVIGQIAYDKKGDRTTVDYVWYVWKKGPDGKITYVQIGS